MRVGGGGLEIVCVRACVLRCVVLLLGVRAACCVLRIALSCCV